MPTRITREFIEAIPKTDLHVHLDGSLRLNTLIELAQNGRIELPSFTPEGLRELVFKERYADLGEYLTGFAYTCAVLRGKEALERVTFELAEDNLAEGVRYLEVRFAPQLLAHNDLTLEETIQAVTDGLERAKCAHNASEAVRSGADLPFECGVIICAMRRFNKAMGLHYHQLLTALESAPKRDIYAMASLEMARVAVGLRDRVGLPIVGFDLAGEEAGYPAGYHREAYRFAHSHFLKKTVHAGEAYGPESIFQAITECHSNRIGHGTFIFASEMVQDASVESPETYTEQLVEYIASQRITLEVCLTSSLQTTPSIASVAEHPLGHMLEHALSVSICTDNRLVSNTTVTDELALVSTHLPVTPHQFRNLILAGFKGSFYPGSCTAKRDFVRQVIRRYDALAEKMLGEDNGEAPDQKA
ncbi:MAG: adenosine deaminase family protein [Lentisphaerae bacterium]|nr:adenosine deaminase family protein [Lentisphaerota bacterium]